MAAKKRKDVVEGKTIKCKTDCGSLYLTLNKQDNELIEIRITLGKSGSCVRGLLEHIALLYSIILQSDIDKEELIRIFKRHCEKVSCGTPFMKNKVNYLSCIDYVASEVLKVLNETKEGQKT